MQLIKLLTQFYCINCFVKGGVNLIESAQVWSVLITIDKGCWADQDIIESTDSISRDGPDVT